MLSRVPYAISMSLLAGLTPILSILLLLPTYLNPTYASKSSRCCLNGDPKSYHLESIYYLKASLEAQTLKNLPANAGHPGSVSGWGRSPLEGKGNPLQYSFAWKIPWTEEPGRLQSMGLQRVGHDWAPEHLHSLSLFSVICICARSLQSLQGSRWETVTGPAMFCGLSVVSPGRVIYFLWVLVSSSVK